MTGLYGLVGKTLGHSFSPLIHRLIFDRWGIDGCYHLFEMGEDRLGQAVDGLQALGAKGVNVTVPYKIPIIEYLADVSPEARKIGSINTIAFPEGKSVGYNTDYQGFGLLLDQYGIDVTNKKAVILGSGGSARTIVHYLLDHGINELTLVGRDLNRLRPLANRLGVGGTTYNQLHHVGGDLLINCTPVGMYPEVDASPVDRRVSSNFPLVIDLIYNPLETSLLRYVREGGGEGINGLYMLVGQALAAQRIWNGIIVDPDGMDEIYEGVKAKILR